MSNLSWDNTQDSKLFDEPFSEETIIDSLNLRFTPTNAKFVVLSTTLPYTPEELTDKAEVSDNGVIIPDVKIPRVLEDTKFYISCRISLNGETADKYFYVEARNIETTWDIDETLIEKAVYDELNIQLKLKNANGDEVFKKIYGTLPSNVFLSESGKLYGMITENDSDTDFVFGIGIFRNGKLVNTESLKPIEIVINVSSKLVDTSPYWITESGSLGDVTTGNSVRLSVYAYSPLKHKLTYYIKDELSSNEYDILPGLHFQRDTGIITGTPITKQAKTWHFTVYAKDGSIERQTQEREFWINSNPISADMKLHWYQNGVKLNDDIEYIDLGSYKIGETFSGKLMAKSDNGDLPVTYIVTIGTPPNGFVLYPNGEYAGSYGGELDFQQTKTYNFKVQATNGQDTIETEFRITAEANLGYNAVNACLRLNLENLSDYDNIKSQLKIGENYKGFNKKYRTGSLPKIDICKLNCFDKILLSAMLEDYGNAEKITFRKTEQKNFSDGLDDYDVFYKTLDEDTFQWTNAPYGSYDYEETLDVLKRKDEDYKNAELEWNVPGKYISTLEPTEEMILSSYAGINYYTENMEMKTVTLTVTPADSDIILECSGYNMIRNGNTASITVPRGAVVRYRVSHEGYISYPSNDLPLGIIEAKTNISKNIILLRESSYSLSVSCSEPESNYIVYFDTQKLEEDYPDIPYILDEDYESGERTIYVPETFIVDGVERNVNVTYTVSSTGYISKTNSEYITEPNQVSVLTLDKEKYTLTFEVLDNITGEDITNECDISITVGNSTINESSITVPYKTIVTVSVSRDKYKTTTVKYIAINNSYNIIRLTPEEMVTIKVINEHLVEDVNIEVIAGNVRYSGVNKVEFSVDYGTDVTYTASSKNYETYSRTISNIQIDTTEEIVMKLKKYSMTIIPTPADSNVKLWVEEYGEGTSIEGTGSQTLDVTYGQTLKWEISIVGYSPKTGSELCKGPLSKSINLNINYYTVKLNVTQEQPTTGTVDNPKITLTSEGATQSGNSITVPYGSSVSWTVENKHYSTQSGIINNISENMNKGVYLRLVYISATVSSKYENISTPAVVRLTSGRQDSTNNSSNSLSVRWGDVINYYITKEHFNQYKPNKRAEGSINVQPDYDGAITYTPDMDIDYYRTTIISVGAGISNAVTITASDGTSPSDNSISTKYGVSITYIVRGATGVISKTITPEESNVIYVGFNDNNGYSWSKNTPTTQTFSIQGTGVYELTLVGGAGGSCSAGSGGKGTYVSGEKQAIGGS